LVFILLSIVNVNCKTIETAMMHNFGEHNGILKSEAVSPIAASVNDEVLLQVVLKYLFEAYLKKKQQQQMLNEKMDENYDDTDENEIEELLNRHTRNSKSNKMKFWKRSRLPKYTQLNAKTFWKRFDSDDNNSLSEE
jgi:hypothetical protein